MSEENGHNETPVPRLTLFVTGDAPRSRRARANLASALDELGLAEVAPFEVDLFRHPEESVTHSVFATPALLKTGDAGDVSVLYGDLSDADSLKRFLADLGPD